MATPEQKAEFKRIVSKLEEAGIDAYDMGENQAWAPRNYPHKKAEKFQRLGFGPVKEVVNECEGQDYDVQINIFHFLASDIYIKIQGYRSSMGYVVYTEGFVQVEPEIITKTVFTTI